MRVLLILTHYHLSGNLPFRASHRIDPFIRFFVRDSLSHTNHVYFIDPRPIGYTVLLRTDFDSFQRKLLRQLSADFPELLTYQFPKYASRSIREDVSRRYSIIPSIQIISSHKTQFYGLNFSFCNVSHRSLYLPLQHSGLPYPL